MEPFNLPEFFAIGAEGPAVAPPPRPRGRRQRVVWADKLLIRFLIDNAEEMGPGVEAKLRIMWRRWGRLNPRQKRRFDRKPLRSLGEGRRFVIARRPPIARPQLPVRRPPPPADVI